MKSAKIIRAFPTGNILIPPSKSLSHRALICAGLTALNGNGESLLKQVGENEDIVATQSCLENLGIIFSHEDNGTRVHAGHPPSHPPVMDCGESGSTLRFLLPIAALQHQAFSFTGHGRLLERPLNVYQKLFDEKGVRFERHKTGLIIQGPLPAGEYRLPGDISSQFVSGLLFALPLLSGDSKIVLETPLESAAYVTLTLNVMAHFGIMVKREDALTFQIPGRQSYRPKQYRVEGDWSQAAFFLAAGVLGRPTSCLGLSSESAQGDMAIVRILEDMGASLSWQADVLTASPGPLSAVDIDVREIPDLVPPLAVLCSLAHGTSRITGAGRLRLKESDRLDAMTRELKKLGADIRQEPDGLIIKGKEWLKGGNVDAHGDHRIAMAMATAAIRCREPVLLTGWEHVKKSYPEFWADFEKEEYHV